MPLRHPVNSCLTIPNTSGIITLVWSIPCLGWVGICSYLSLQEKCHATELYSEIWIGILKRCLPLHVHHSSNLQQPGYSTNPNVHVRRMNTQNMIPTHNGILFSLRNEDSSRICNNVVENNVLLNEMNNSSTKRQMFSVLTHVQKLKQSELPKAESGVVVTRNLGTMGGKFYLKGGCLTQDEGGTLKIHCTAWWIPLIMTYNMHFKTIENLVWGLSLQNSHYFSIRGRQVIGLFDSSILCL